MTPTAVGFPDELPRRRRNMPDWSNLESAQRWRFHPVPVPAKVLSAPLMLGDQRVTRWCTDPATVNRVYQWMLSEGWGNGE
jgi:hypothetical protein